MLAPPLATAHTTHQCMQTYGYRRFLMRSEQRHYRPPLLWTFPGAGNTLLRMLIDFSTGIYTGSVYGDASLLPLLPGEGRCDRSVVAVKAHPQHVDSIDFLPTPSGALRLNVTRKPHYVKCQSLRFDGAIVVLRDPYAAIWAEYKRYVSWKEVVGNKHAQSPQCQQALRAQSMHSGALLRACFDRAHFSRHALHLARDWKHMWYHYSRFQRARRGRLLQLSFDRLVDPHTRLAALRSIVDFLRLTPAPSDDALACAFQLAENPHIHRDRRAEAVAGVASVSDAYTNRTLVCSMWRLMRRTAAKAGFAPFGGVIC